MSEKIVKIETQEDLINTFGSEYTSDGIPLVTSTPYSNPYVLGLPSRPRHCYE